MEFKTTKLKICFEELKDAIDDTASLLEDHEYDLDSIRTVGAVLMNAVDRVREAEDVLNFSVNLAMRGLIAARHGISMAPDGHSWPMLVSSTGDEWSPSALEGFQYREVRHEVLEYMVGHLDGDEKARNADILRGFFALLDALL